MNPNSCYLSYSRKTPPKWKDMKLIKLCFFAFVHLCFFDKNRLAIFDIWHQFSTAYLCEEISNQRCEERPGGENRDCKKHAQEPLYGKMSFLLLWQKVKWEKKYQFANVNFCAIWYGIFLPFELPLAMFISLCGVWRPCRSP